MNFLPARSDAAGVNVAGQRVMAANARLAGSDALTLGVRPEYVMLAASGAPGALPAIVYAGAGHRHLLARHRARRQRRERILDPRPPQSGAEHPAGGDAVWLNIVGPHTCFYRNEELIAEATA